MFGRAGTLGFNWNSFYGGYWVSTETSSYSPGRATSLDPSPEGTTTTTTSRFWVWHSGDDGTMGQRNSEQTQSGPPGDTDNWWSNFKTAVGMTSDWLFGDGPESRSFYNDDVAGAMKNAWRVNQAREFFYNKYKGASSLKGASVTNFQGSFGIQGLLRAGVDPIEQFIGSYTVNIYASPNGKELTFVLWNNSSTKSLLYGIGPAWGRESFEPGGNMYQNYIWTEPIRK